VRARAARNVSAAPLARDHGTWICHLVTREMISPPRARQTRGTAYLPQPKAWCHTLDQSVRTRARLGLSSEKAVKTAVAIRQSPIVHLRRLGRVSTCALVGRLLRARGLLARDEPVPLEVVRDRVFARFVICAGWPAKALGRDRSFLACCGAIVRPCSRPIRPSGDVRSDCRRSAAVHFEGVRPAPSASRRSRRRAPFPPAPNLAHQTPCLL